jgi:TPR repeat protein
MYKNGTGVQRDYKKAIELYSRAIAMGSTMSAGNLVIARRDMDKKCTIQ